MSADNGQLSVADLLQMWAEADRLRGADSRMVMPRDPDWLNTRERMIREAVGGTPEAPEDGDGEDEDIDWLCRRAVAHQIDGNHEVGARLLCIAARLRSHTREPDVRKALERILWAHDDDFADDHDAAIQNGHDVLNASVHPLTQGGDE